MKKLILCFVFLALCNFLFAQTQVTIKGGTIVPVEAVKNLRAKDARIGQTVDFKVTRNIIVDGIVAIPEGTIVKGSVFEAQRSMAFGIKGRLGIKLRHAYLPSGDIVSFSSSDIYIQGKSRTALAIIIFICTYVPLPCGTRAELKTGIEYDATVATNTTITVE